MRVDAPDADAMEAFGRSLAARLRAGDLVLLDGPARRGQDHAHPRPRRGPRRAGAGARAPPSCSRARTRTSRADRRSCTSTRTGSAAPPELDDLDLDFDRSIVVVEWGAGLLDDVGDSWLEVVIERPEGAPVDGSTDAADAELLGAEEPRVLEVRGYGPRWAGSPFAAAQ